MLESRRGQAHQKVLDALSAERDAVLRRSEESCLALIKSRRSMLLSLLALPFAAVTAVALKDGAASSEDRLSAQFNAWSASRSFVVTETRRG